MLQAPQQENGYDCGVYVCKVRITTLTSLLPIYTLTYTTILLLRYIFIQFVHWVLLARPRSTAHMLSNKFSSMINPSSFTADDVAAERHVIRIALEE